MRDAASGHGIATSAHDPPSLPQYTVEPKFKSLHVQFNPQPRSLSVPIFAKSDANQSTSPDGETRGALDGSLLSSSTRPGTQPALLIRGCCPFPHYSALECLKFT